MNLIDVTITVFPAVTSDVLIPQNNSRNSLFHHPKNVRLTWLSKLSNRGTDRVSIVPRKDFSFF